MATLFILTKIKQAQLPSCVVDKIILPAIVYIYNFLLTLPRHVLCFCIYQYLLFLLQRILHSLKYLVYLVDRLLSEFPCQQSILRRFIHITLNQWIRTLNYLFHIDKYLSTGWQMIYQFASIILLQWQLIKKFIKCLQAIYWSLCPNWNKRVLMRGIYSQVGMSFARDIELVGFTKVLWRKMKIRKYMGRRWQIKW